MEKYNIFTLHCIITLLMNNFPNLTHYFLNEKYTKPNKEFPNHTDEFTILINYKSH